MRTVGLTFKPEANSPRLDDISKAEINTTPDIPDILDQEINLQDMTIPQLKEYAVEAGIELKGAVTKKDIIKRILEPTEV